MPAGFFPTGTVELFFKLRRLQTQNETQDWKYLGSSVTAPDVTATVTHTPFTCDYNAPAPFQLIFNSESHRLAVTANRLNFRNYTTLKNSVGGGRKDLGIKRFVAGELVLNVYDFEFFVQYALPTGGLSGPDGSPRGRLYYSSVLTDFHETTENSRVQEVTFLFDCHPLYFFKSKEFRLYTELPGDLPALTPE